MGTSYAIRPDGTYAVCRYLAQATHSYYSVSPFLADLANYPENDSLKRIAAGLAEGWRAYGNDEAAVLFVVQEGERNVFDQRWLEYELLEGSVHSHPVQQQTCSHPRAVMAYTPSDTLSPTSPTSRRSTDRQKRSSSLALSSPTNPPPRSPSSTIAPLIRHPTTPRPQNGPPGSCSSDLELSNVPPWLSSSPERRRSSKC